ncbi:hypothetical protein ILUMI_00596 [Ignelater luminosus]|uniref:Uncharacterized protein n=1 Tax=Ignelater luminosus TaxID=2038154 RepID=A0A8K0DLB1_IGNLU|nr:hypothetical protein ILUMI_00596 [Ignelater luminosus]
MFYSGVPRYERARGGVAFMVSNNLIKNVDEDETIIAAYGPNEDATLGEKNQFFNLAAYEEVVGRYANGNSRKRQVNREPKFKINYDKLRSPEVREEFVQSVEQEIANQVEALGEEVLYNSEKLSSRTSEREHFIELLEGMNTAPETEPLVTLDTIPEFFSEEKLNIALKKTKIGKEPNGGVHTTRWVEIRLNMEQREQRPNKRIANAENVKKTKETSRPTTEEEGEEKEGGYFCMSKEEIDYSKTGAKEKLDEAMEQTGRESGYECTISLPQNVATDALSTTTKQEAAKPGRIDDRQKGHIARDCKNHLHCYEFDKEGNQADTMAFEMYRKLVLLNRDKEREIKAKAKVKADIVIVQEPNIRLAQTAGWMMNIKPDTAMVVLNQNL